MKLALEKAEKFMDEKQKNGFTAKKYGNYEYYTENPSLSVWKIIKK